MMSVFSQMKTDEYRRNLADRNIGITELGCIMEFLGNSYGDKVFIYYSGSKLLIFSNDGGFTEADKDAIRMKNRTGNANLGASLNGIGVKLAVDRMLKKTKDENGVEGGKYPAVIYSVTPQENKTLRMACFQTSEWRDMTDDEYDEYHELVEENLGNSQEIYGSLWMIPLNFKFRDYINENWNHIKQNILRFMNRKIAKHNIQVYIRRQGDSSENPIPLEVPILNCPENETFTQFRLRIYESLEGITNSQGKKLTAFLISHIQHHGLCEDKRAKLLDFPQEIVITKKDFHYSDLSDMESFQSDQYEIVDELEIRSAILEEDEIKEQKKIYNGKVTELGGLAIYVNGLYINEKALQRHLGGKALGVFGNTCYGGNPRFEVECSKNTVCFKLPSDKVNVVETELGIKVMKLIKIWNECLHKPSITEKLTIPWQKKAYVKHRWNLGKYTGRCGACDKIMYLDNPSHYKLVLYRTELERGDLFEWRNIVPICKSCEKMKTPGRSLYDYLQTISEGQRTLFQEKYEFYLADHNEHRLEENIPA